MSYLWTDFPYMIPLAIRIIVAVRVKLVCICRGPKEVRRRRGAPRDRPLQDCLGHLQTTLPHNLIMYIQVRRLSTPSDLLQDISYPPPSIASSRRANVRGTRICNLLSPILFLPGWFKAVELCTRNDSPAVRNKKWSICAVFKPAYPEVQWIGDMREPGT